MIFAHGFGCDQNMWRHVAPAFENDYKTILFDYVGAGKSDLSTYEQLRYSSLDGYAQDVLDICEAFDIKDAVFIGHSVSSMIGILAHLQQPRMINNLILIGPSPRYLNDLPVYKGGFERSDLESLIQMMKNNYLGWANYLAPVIMKNPERPDLTKELESSFCATDPIIGMNFARATFFSDNRADIQKVQAPTLILQCSEDTIAPTEVGQYMHRNMPNSTIKYMKATGHCPHLSHPEETTQAIRDYLKERSL